jgi:transposase
VSAEAFSVALAQFARDVGVGPKKQVLLVLDGAGWHTSLETRIPPHVHLVFLPPYSPELQPAEHLWPLVNEVVANRPFENLDDLEDVVLERCMKLRADPNTIHRHTLFHWWHDVEEAVA